MKPKLEPAKKESTDLNQDLSSRCSCEAGPSPTQETDVTCWWCGSWLPNVISKRNPPREVSPRLPTSQSAAMRVFLGKSLLEKESFLQSFHSKSDDPASLDRPRIPELPIDASQNTIALPLKVEGKPFLEGQQSSSLLSRLLLCAGSVLLKWKAPPIQAPSSSLVRCHQTDPGNDRLAFLHQARRIVQAKSRVRGSFYEQAMDVLERISESEFWLDLAHLSIARLLRIEAWGHSINDSEKRRALKAGQLRLSDFVQKHPEIFSSLLSKFGPLDGEASMTSGDP